MDNFLEGVAAQGRHDSVGEFSVDWTAADRKLADFYRQHPGLWFVKFIQAALSVRSHAVTVKDGRTVLTISCSTQERLPSLSRILIQSSETREHLSTGIKAVFGCEPELDELKLVSIPPVGSEQREVLTLSRGGEHELGKPDSELETDLNFGTGQFGASLYIRLSWKGGSWWEALRRRIRRQVMLYKLCSERLTFCPVPIQFSGFSFGQGSGRPYQAVATEYILGSLLGDTIVRENEPGNGSRVFDLFGTTVPNLGSHPRYFTRWCQVAHPLLCSENELLEDQVLELYPKPRRGEPRVLLSSVPSNSIGIFKSNFLGYSLLGQVNLPLDFRPSGSANGRDTPGLPVYANIVIPPQLSGPSRVHFYRRGVLMCQGPMELGLPGIEAHVCCEQLKTDFSGMAVVRDDTFAQLEAVLRERVIKLARDTVAQGFGWRTRYIEKALAAQN